jgi:hypothetical protein
MKMDLQKESVYHNTIPSGSVYGVYKNHKEARKAIEMIVARGYQREEIDVFPPDMGDLVPRATPNHFPKGNTVMKESLKGLRNGAILGAMASVIVVAVFMIVDGDFSQASLLFGIHSLVVLMIIFGAVLGFFINPHLPKPVSKFFSKTPEEKVSLHFEAHNEDDIRYFSEKGKLRVAE